MSLRLKIINIVLLLGLGAILFLAWQGNMELYEEIDDFTENYGEIIEDSDSKQSFFIQMSYVAGGIFLLLLLVNILARIRRNNTGEEVASASFLLDDEDTTSTETEVMQTNEEWAADRAASWNGKVAPQKLLSELAGLTEALSGLMYLKKGKKLECAARFAHAKPVDDFEVGEGITGEVAASQHPVMINDIPADYDTEGSGLGDSQPATIFILPVIHNKRTKGVVELALMKELPDDLREKALALASVGAQHLQKESK